jgi:hypothetical protein
VHVLPKILQNDEAYKQFLKGPVKATDATKSGFALAKKLVEQNEPEIGSDFFKLLEKMRQACTDAAQVKEILKIRSDKTARQRLIDTYEALVGFMALADVDPDELDNKKRKSA